MDDGAFSSRNERAAENEWMEEEGKKKNPLNLVCKFKVLDFIYFSIYK